MRRLNPSHHSFMFQYGGGSAAITRTPREARPITCLKNISAVPETGGKQTSGQLTDFGPQSNILHAYKKLN